MKRTNAGRRRWG